MLKVIVDVVSHSLCDPHKIYYYIHTDEYGGELDICTMCYCEYRRQGRCGETTSV